MNHISLVLAKQNTSGGCSASRPSRVIIIRDEMGKLHALGTPSIPGPKEEEKKILKQIIIMIKILKKK